MRLYDTVVAHCQEHGLKFAVAPEQGRVQLIFDSRNCPVGLHCTIDALENRAAVVVHVMIPILTPPARRAEVAELACRVNFNLLIGGFDFDVDRGLLLYRTSTCFLGQPSPGPDAIEPLLGLALSTADQWAPAFLAVAAESTTAREAHARLADAHRATAAQVPRDLLDAMLDEDEDDRKKRGAA